MSKILFDWNDVIIAVREILDKGEHKLSSDTLLQVIALESLTPDLIDKVCAIRVTNIPPNMSRDLIECHFESERRSGGDDFEEVYHDENNQSATIVYKSVEGSYIVFFSLNFGLS